MACQTRNILNVVRARQNGKQRKYGQNSVASFSEDVAVSSLYDNKACTLPGSLRSTFLVVFSHDRTLMASSHGNHCIYVTRLATGQCIQTLEGHPRTPWCVTFHPTSNEILASGCLGGEVRVWDLHGSSEVWVSEHCTMIASLAFHPHDQVLAIATDNQILLWDWRQPEPFASVKTTSPLEKVRLVRFDPLGHFMLTGITNVNDDDAEVDVDISTPRESTVSMNSSNSDLPSRPTRSRSMAPDSYPNPSSADPAPPPPPPPPLPSSFHYGTRRPMPVDPPTSSSSTARPASPDAASRVSEAQDYAAAVTLSALGLRRVTRQYRSQRENRAQRENDLNRLRGRTYAALEEQRLRARLQRYLGHREARERAEREEALHRSRSEEPFYLWSNPADTDSARTPSAESMRTQSAENVRTPRELGSQSSSTDNPAIPVASGTALSLPRTHLESESNHPLSTEGPSSSTAAVRHRTDITTRVVSSAAAASEVLSAADIIQTAAEAGNDEPSTDINSNASNTLSNANQSPRSYRYTIHYVRAGSSNNSRQSNDFQFYRRRGNSNRGSRIHDEMFDAAPPPSQVQSDEQTPSSTSRCTPRQQGNNPDPPQPRSPCRQRRATWESGHASHWRRIERSSTLPSAHVAHLGRVPDTPPPPPTSDTGSTSGEGSSSVLETAAREREMVTETAESSRPTLLRAAPITNVPPVASSSAAVPPAGYNTHSSPHSRRTIPALLHHGHGRRHMYHMGQDRRRERDDGSSPGGPETRRARVSRYGFSRTSLGRRTSQAALHRHYARHSSSSIFDGDENRPPSSSIHQYINRAIANAFAGRGETAVANNIGNTTYRLQWWDFQDFQLPDISRAEINVVVPHCKLHNDASCDIAQDGSLLAVFVPSPLGFPDDGELSIYSLMQHNFGDVLYTKSFGPNAITVSLSPLAGYVMVGLAARKLHWNASTKQLMAQIFRLAKPGSGEDSLTHVMDINHTNDTERRSQVSVNIAKWLPEPGKGFVYGTNRGHLRICTPRCMPCDEGDDVVPPSDGETESSDDEITRRINLARRRLALSSAVESSGLTMPERRARGTQTARRIQFSIATQTDAVGTNTSSAQSSSTDTGAGTSSAGQTDAGAGTSRSSARQTDAGASTSSAGQSGNTSEEPSHTRTPNSRDSSTQIMTDNSIELPRTNASTSSASHDASETSLGTITSAI